ncbi:hypothetical protein GCM10009557_20900 [Virgisporangium ochraceum]|nr:hypothetical protein [Virgisporangium ochraceum]
MVPGQCPVRLGVDQDVLARSGIGREFGLDGILEFTEEQTLQW